jgi:hypothetical protein
MATSDSRKFLQEYILFFGTVLVLGIILFLLIFGTRTKWENGLRTQTQAVLNRVYPDKYQVGEAMRRDNSPVRVNSPSLSVRFRITESIKSDGGRTAKYCAIAKVSTIFGPLPAVYVYETSAAGAQCHFAGFAGGFARYEKKLEQEKTKSRSQLKKEAKQKEIEELFDWKGQE